MESSFEYGGLVFRPLRSFTRDEAENTYRYIEGPAPFSPANWDHSAFYSAGGAGSQACDLFLCGQSVVCPLSAGLGLFKATTEQALDARINSRKKTLTTSLLSVIDQAGTDEFFPTPSDLVHDMVLGLPWNEIESVLEPSAGRGDLIDSARHWRRMAGGTFRDDLDIDCIELNRDLRAVLKARDYRVVASDFLRFSTLKHYDLILMNPPFSEGDRHLLKAIDLVSNGGIVVCLLNANTIKNPCTARRRELANALERYDAEVTFYDSPFSAAPRSTDVDVAMVKVIVPTVARESTIFESMKRAETLQDPEPQGNDELSPADWIERLVREFRIEAAAGVELIRQYGAMIPHLLSSYAAERYNPPMLELKCNGRDLVSANTYLELVRKKYWEYLLQNPAFVGRLTKALQDKYIDMLHDLRGYDFSVENIQRIAVEMNAELVGGLEAEILKVFDKLTTEHAWYPECARNRHYYSGWASNKAHKVNGKVIIPSYGIFADASWRRDTFKVDRAYALLSDIEKVLNYLDGAMTAEVDLADTLKKANDAKITRNIHTKYFGATFFKKGTTHLVFHKECLPLIEKLNIYASQKKNWLPPNYGRVRYSEMDAESQRVVDEFQGEKAYADVLACTDYYLAENSQAFLPSASVTA